MIVNRTMLTEKLTKFGLTEKEAAIYLTLLKFGTSTVSDIAKISKLNRSTSYVLLETLSQKGLVTTTEQQSPRFYTAVPPERFLSISEERMKQASSLLGLAKGVLPELLSIQKTTEEKPKTQFFEGEEGIKNIYEDTLTSGETIREFASVDDAHAVMPEYHRRRAEKGIRIRTIAPDTDAARERMRADADEARESMLVPTSQYAFPSEIDIYDNKVVFVSPQERFGLMIESKEIAEALKKVFDLSWAEAKRFKKQRS